jgi:hypothetical protein
MQFSRASPVELIARYAKQSEMADLWKESGANQSNKEYPVLLALAAKVLVSGTASQALIRVVATVVKWHSGSTLCSPSSRGRLCKVSASGNIAS